MAKNIALFFDGTWQAAADYPGGKATARIAQMPRLARRWIDRSRREKRKADTNVAKLHRYVEHAAKSDQESKYFKGIGTQLGKVRKYAYGITGYGLTRNVEAGYRFIVDHYEPGDRIYLFGFSRGAFTARTLAGMCGFLGILEEKERDLIPEMLKRYMHPSRAWPLDLRDLLRSLPDAHNEDRRPLQIHFLGVWDTVAALGVPPHSAPRLKRIIRHWTERHAGALPAHITHARHALALHELRGDYEPALWTDFKPTQSLKQCWFAGNHSDVGGGYPETVLSDHALKWMAEEAIARGLKTNAGWSPTEIASRMNLGGVHDEIRLFNIGDPTIRSLLTPGAISAASSGIERSTYIHRSAVKRLNHLNGYSHSNVRPTVARALREVDRLTMPLYFHQYFTRAHGLES
jgi:T6SS, Phospholipase effector Tle1-like, catalytic domain